MQITVENAGGCKRIIRAEIPAETVSQKLNEGYREINRQVTFPGFRKGKAPRHLLEQRFGGDIRNDVRQTLADDALKQAVEANALKILGQAELVGDVKIEGNAPATLTLEAEVYPEFDLPEYKGLTVERPVPKLQEHELYGRQRSEQLHVGKVEPVNGPAEKGHIVRINLRIQAGDEVIYRQNGGLLDVGYPWIAGMKPEGAEKELVGAKAGESRTLKATLPADFGRDDLRGKSCDLHLEILEVLSYEGPSLEEYAKQLGKESLAAWGEELKVELTRQKEQDIDRLVEEKLILKVLEGTKMDLPEKFSVRRAAELVQQEAYRMYRAGAPEEEIRQFLADNKDKGVDEVKNMLKRAFVIDAIAR
ncbi:MAG: trigger factor, partial [Planctomycetes bacterium]|nr:trigger factor [Planctomycetota bacterium]